MSDASKDSFREAEKIINSDFDHMETYSIHFISSGT